MAATADNVLKPDFDASRKHFIFTDEHQQLRESIRRFAQKELAPHAEEWEETTFPDSVFERMGELGFLGLDKPEEYGGQGGDYYSSLVLAGALGIALACDLIIAREGARFGTPEINVGVFPFMIMALIYRNVGRKKTNEMLLLGERIDAEEAQRIGIVNRVVPAEGFEEAVQAWAVKLAAKSPVLMRMGKDAIYRQMDMAFEDALDYLRAQLTIAFSTEDIQEGVKAFFEKREPEWKGR